MQETSAAQRGFHVSLAPMAGYTDLPFRRMCRRSGLVYASTALIDAGALVHANPDNSEILHRGDEEPWLQVQLLGSIPADVRQAVRLLREGRWRYDALDFNMGCPVRKVLRRHAGAALMRCQELAMECVRIIREEWPGPFTVKTRILDEVDPAPTVELARRLCDEGVEGLTIHGRLAERIYAGPVHGEIIAAVREAVPVPVTANGGIFSLEDAQALAASSGCRRLMVARGSLGNPWLFRDLVDGVKHPKPTPAEVIDAAEEHLALMMAEYGETGAMILGRKILSSYICGRGFSRALRAQVVTISTWAECQAMLDRLRSDPVTINKGE